MGDYSHIFSDAETKYNNFADKTMLFMNFRNTKEVYGFIDNGDEPPFEEADTKAQKINKDMYDKYILSINDRAPLGYGTMTPKYKYNHLDSSHIMMSIICFTYITTPIKNVVEIGGGYGNWLFLNRWQTFDKWYIIDLPYLLALQRWYISNQNITDNKYELVSAYEADKWPTASIDLVIGAHSLSEISLTAFLEYKEKILKHTKYLLYSHNINCPSQELINLKNNHLNELFDIVYEIYTENNVVRTVLLKAKE